ncbi:MAG TPA: hypothetical protein VFH68_09015, partial [Polyangia bacterium]|nr:hypothetical protein [Polyangia bacterium]
LPPRGTAPIAADRTVIAWLSCQNDPASALYTAAGLEARTAIAPIAPAAVRSSSRSALATANAILLRVGCPDWAGNEPALGQAGFRQRYQAGDYQIWIRNARP